MILGVHHTAITTCNLDRLLKFYCDLFGFTRIDESAWRVGDTMTDRIMGLEGSSGRFALIHLNNACLEIVEFITPKSPGTDPSPSVTRSGLMHICLGVTDLDAEYERLKAAGVIFHCAPMKPLDPKHSHARATYGRDPDGNVFELLELTGAAPFAVKASGVDWRSESGANPDRLSGAGAAGFSNSHSTGRS